MPRTYRSATPREKAKLEKSRQMMERGIQGEGDFLSKISTTMAKAARDDQKLAKEMYYSVPEEAREGEAYNYAGYETGGEVKKSRSYQKQREDIISGAMKNSRPSLYDMQKAEKLMSESNKGPRVSEYDMQKAEKLMSDSNNDILETYKAGGIVKVRGQGAARMTKGCKIT